MSKNIIIATYGVEGRTGSTAVVNIIQGLVQQWGRIRTAKDVEQSLKQTGVVKSHFVPESSMEGHYDLVITIERQDTIAKDAKHYLLPNTPGIVFSHEELYKSGKTDDELVDFVAIKLQEALPDIELNRESALHRLYLVNRAVRLMEHIPFNVYDPYTHIHGSHRDRGNNVI